jgi:tetratricopeptide (TPR) repeat protein
MLRALRVRAGLTQEQLAELSGLSVRAISDIERGITARPRRSSVALLEAALKEFGGNGAVPSQDALSADGKPPVLQQLPPAVPGFTGRARELDALTHLLAPAGAASGTVVISAIAGAGGVGKTALALHWAHQAAENYPDGQLYVNLRGYDPDRPVPAGSALTWFLRALGVAGPDIPPEEDERAALYRSLLAGRRMLVVLDNAGSPEQVRPLLPGTVTCNVLVTSRDSLAGLVARDGAARLDLDLLPMADAVALLRVLIGERADADPGAAGALAAQCSRLPLALRVAAEFVTARPDMRLASLVGELTDQQRRLDLLDADGDPRAGVRAVFSWSYRNLGAAPARMFRLLGLHPGADLDAHAGAALCDMDLADAAEVLGLLARTHLIQRAAPGRYDLHDLLRAYARELAATGDSEDDRNAALTRLLDHYLHAAAAAMDTLYPSERSRRPRIPAPASPVPLLADPAPARAWLDTERANLIALAAYAADWGWSSHVTRLAATLARYLEVGGHYPEAVALYGHAGRAARDTGDRVAEAAVLNNLAVIDLRLSRWREAADYLEQALALGAGTGDLIGQARALGNLGITYYQQGRYYDAIEHHGQALGLYRRAADHFGEARTLNNLGVVELYLGQYPQAIDHLGGAETLSREKGVQQVTAYALLNLGALAIRQKRYRQATANLTGAIALSREITHAALELNSLVYLARIDLLEGRHKHAAGRLAHALKRSREIGARSVELEALSGQGELALATGRAARAITSYRAALGLADSLGEQYEQARAHDGLARSHRAAGDGALARHHGKHALDLFSSLGTPEAEEVRALLSGLLAAAGPGTAAGLGHRDGGRHRHVQRSDPAGLRDIGNRVGHSEQRGRAAAILIADGQADVAVQRRLGQRHGAGGQLDRHHPQARGRRGLGRGDRIGLHRGLDQPLGAERGLGHAGMAERGRAAAQPQVLRAEGGRRADDRAHVERLSHRVEQQRQAPLAGPAPLAVEPLDLGGAKLPGRALGRGNGRVHEGVTPARSA